MTSRPQGDQLDTPASRRGGQKGSVPCGYRPQWTSATGRRTEQIVFSHAEVWLEDTLSLTPRCWSHRIAGGLVLVRISPIQRSGSGPRLLFTTPKEKSSRSVSTAASKRRQRAATLAERNPDRDRRGPLRDRWHRLQVGGARGHERARSRTRTPDGHHADDRAPARRLGGRRDRPDRLIYGPSDAVACPRWSDRALRRVVEILRTRACARWRWTTPHDATSAGGQIAAIGGGRSAQGRSASICAASDSSVVSRLGLPTIWTARGRPCDENPAGTDAAG
jgi:hypothetical protein